MLHTETQNLRNALDSMYDARVPVLWKKVSHSIDTIIIARRFGGRKVGESSAIRQTN